MSKLSFVAFHYLALALLALFSYIFGRRLTQRVTYHSLLEQASLSLTLGLGVIAYLVLFLGLLRLLYPSLLIACLLLGLLICYPVWRGWARDLPVLWQRVRRSGKGHIALVSTGAMIMLVLLIPILTRPLYPPFESDATMYHLASVKMYTQQHKLVATPYLRYPVLPQTNQMLFTLALLLYDDILAQLIELLMMVTLVAALIALGQRYFSTQVGLWSAALLLGNPLVLWLGWLAYIDMGLTLFATTTVYAFWNWLQVREQSWLVLAAVFCGLAVGTKSPALFFLGTLTIVAFYACLRKRNYLPPLLFATIALLVAAPWLVRSFYYTGNPVFPLFYQGFGRLFGYGQSQPEYYKGLVEAISSSGNGTSFKSLVTLPWHLAFNQKVFQVEAFISPIYFFALPLLLIFGIAKARIRGLLALVLAYTLFWFYSVQVMRFLVVILPLLSLTVAASLDLLLKRLPFLRSLRSYKIVTAIVCVALVYPGYEYAMTRFQEQNPLPVTQEQRDNYLSRSLPSYSSYKLLNDLKGRNYSVYAFNDAGMAYFADGLFMGDWFGPSAYSHLLDKFSDGQSLYAELRLLKADHLLLRDSPYKLKPPTDDFFESHFKPINTMLFELTEKPFKRQIVEILQNPGFEELNNGWPTGWSFSGNPQVLTSAPLGSGNSVEVQSNGAGDVLYQWIAVPGRSYLLSCEARSLKQGQKAKLQINWYDARAEMLKEEIHMLEVGSERKRHEVNLITPPRAVSAIIYASALDPSVIWFDNFSFSEMSRGRSIILVQPARK